MVRINRFNELERSEKWACYLEYNNYLTDFNPVLAHLLTSKFKSFRTPALHAGARGLHSFVKMRAISIGAVFRRRFSASLNLNS